MATTGTAPPNFNSPTGQFRLLANDAVFSNVVDGFGQYALFSDDDINGLLGLHPESMLRAVGYGYLSLAANAAVQSTIVKDYDLSADLTKRAAELRSTARLFFDRADIEASRLGIDSTFGIDFPAPRRRGRNWIEPTERDVLDWGLF